MENEHNGTVRGGHKDDPGLALAVHRWQEDQRLARFFAKLIGEVTFVEADTVEFKLVGESVSGAILKEGKPIKSLSVKAVWFEPMFRWLQSRIVPISPSNENALSEDECEPCVRVGEHVVFFKTKQTAPLSGARTLTLSQFTVVGYPKALESLGMLPYVKSAFEEIFGGKAGVVLLVHPQVVDWSAALATALAFGGGSYLGDITDPGVRMAARQLGAEHPVCVSIAQQDTVEGLFRLLEWKESLPLSSILGAVSLAFVRKVCSGCARKSATDLTVLKGLPAYFQKIPLDKYVVGRGCATCGQSGYLGVVGLHSVARMTEHLERSLLGGQAQATVMGYLHSRGTKPLFEDGIRKALEGVTTFEAVRQAAQSAPSGYVEYWTSLMAVEAALADTAAAAAGEKQASKVRPQRAADDDTAPLFDRSLFTKQRQKPLVLVVEDDADQRAILELVLKEAKYDVSQAANGQEALKAVENNLPDLVIADLMMPVMDGSEFVSRMKREARFSSIPILMLTMIADEEKEYALLDLGADDYCDKTIQRKVLLKRVENLLKRTRGAERLA